MTTILDSQVYLERILSLPRPGAENILAFYEHRISGICTDPRLLLLPLDDHLTHRGDGVFETIKYSDGRLYQLDQHLARMHGSASGIFLELPCSWEALRKIILDVTAAGKERNGQVRVIAGRGPGGFGIDPSECPISSLYIVAYRYTPKPESWFAKGLSGFRTSIPAKQNYMAKIKNANYLPNVLMLREGKERGMDIPFCYDENGFLAESAVANLCIVDKSGTLLVPELTNALPGTMMQRALELLQGNVPMSMCTITEDMVFDANEILLLGTGPDCVAVVTYENQPIGNGTPGPVSTILRQRINVDILENGVPIPGLI